MKSQASALAIDLPNLCQAAASPKPCKGPLASQRRGRVSKPSAVSERLTVRTGQSPMALKASRSLGPAQPPSVARQAHAEHAAETGACMESKPDEQTSRVGHDMTLSPLDPLSGVLAKNSAAFRGSYTLTVDNPYSRLGFAPVGQTRSLDKHAVHLIQQAVIAPGVEIAPDRGDRRQNTPALMVCGASHCRAVTGTSPLPIRGSRQTPRADRSCGADRSA